MRGVRWWRLALVPVEGAAHPVRRPALLSLTSDFEWPVDAPAVARTGFSSRPSSEPCPASVRADGLYAFYVDRFGLLVRELVVRPWFIRHHLRQGILGLVAGEVEAWGVIRLHEDGFRTQYGMPLGLYGPDPEHIFLVVDPAEVANPVAWPNPLPLPVTVLSERQISLVRRAMRWSRDLLELGREPPWRWEEHDAAGG